MKHLVSHCHDGTEATGWKTTFQTQRDPKKGSRAVDPMHPLLVWLFPHCGVRGLPTLLCDLTHWKD